MEFHSPFIRHGDGCVFVTLPNRVGEYECGVSSKGCWEWPSAYQSSGYGRVKIGGRGTVAHLAVYRELHGTVPGGFQLDHLCRNRRCVNPDHLEPVTPRENQRRGETFTKEKSKQTHCIYGHPLSGKNLFIRRNGRRRCRTCERNRQKKYRSTDSFKAKHAACERMRRLKRKSK